MTLAFGDSWSGTANILPPRRVISITTIIVNTNTYELYLYLQDINYNFDLFSKYQAYRLVSRHEYCIDSASINAAMQF